MQAVRPPVNRHCRLHKNGALHVEALLQSECVTTGEESVETIEKQMGGSGAFNREELKQGAVPMEAAEEHFHLMPSRPAVEQEEDEVRSCIRC